MEAMRANVPHLGELVRPQALGEQGFTRFIDGYSARRVVRWEVSCRRRGWLGVRCCGVRPSHVMGAVPSRRDFFVLASSVSDSDYLLVHSL